jgi:hypothetical protein
MQNLLLFDHSCRLNWNTVCGVIPAMRSFHPRGGRAAIPGRAREVEHALQVLDR